MGGSEIEIDRETGRGISLALSKRYPTFCYNCGDEFESFICFTLVLTLALVFYDSSLRN